MMTEAGNLIHQIVAGADEAARANLISLLDRAIRRTKRIEGMLPIDPKFYNGLDCAELEHLLDSLRTGQVRSAEPVM